MIPIARTNTWTIASRPTVSRRIVAVRDDDDAICYYADGRLIAWISDISAAVEKGATWHRWDLGDD